MIESAEYRNTEYRYNSSSTNVSHEYLLRPVLWELNRFFSESESPRRFFDLGCGNGSVAAFFSEHGFQVVGVDPSEEGISRANKVYPTIRLDRGSAYDDLAVKYGRFSAVISLEVVEHIYAPRHYARTVFDLLEPGGVAILSTPYHSYLKNLALAITGKMDDHFTALWDNGHIKFWSPGTLTTLLEECGLREISFRRVGRVPALAKSMIAIARRPR